MKRISCLLTSAFCVAATVWSTAAFSDINLRQKLELDKYQSKKAAQAAEKNNSLTSRIIQTPAPYIIGGSEVQHGEWPFVVALVVSGSTPTNGQFCGGSLIRPNIVLTAAHCVQGAMPSNINVFVGSHTLSNQDGTGELIPVERIRVHEGFNYDDLSDDIALIYLSKPSSQPTVPTVSLEQMNNIDFGEPLSVAGWGNMDPFGFDAPDLLNSVDVTYIATNICSAAYTELFGFDPITETMICSGTPEGGKDSCNGDSGGPLVANIDGIPHQVGIVSWGTSTCAQQGTYGVYSKVAHFENWIERVISGTIIQNPVADANLQACIIDEAQTHDWTKMADVTSLNCAGWGIDSLSGLGEYTNLTSLNIANNPVSDLVPLQSLTQLAELDISATFVSDINQLVFLPNLESISLFGLTGIDCIDPNGGPYGYDEIANACFDLSSKIFVADPNLQNCITAEIKNKNMWLVDQVNILECKGYGIQSLEGIEHFGSLETLVFDSNFITDITPIENLFNLSALILNNNQISNIGALKNLNNLFLLALWNNQVSDLTPLSDLFNLQVLDLENNNISDLTPLKNLVNLEVIYLFGNNGITCLDVNKGIFSYDEIPELCFAPPIDSDNDGWLDFEDNCPHKKNANQKDTDGDGIGNSCDIDDDNDGFTDPEENRVGSDPTDPNSTPISILTDRDSDGILDIVDNCVNKKNWNQLDFDLDGQGDACDDDDDNDGFSDALENNVGSHPKNPISTPETIATDSDGDGIPNSWDNCVDKANPNQKDTDQDGMGNACDLDDDNDGFTDKEEQLAGTNPRNPDSFPDNSISAKEIEVMASATQTTRDYNF